eukprot:CAMPEP_0183734164 /NCGR_PEP_ID=MMETSP0737-20130205/43075_1 /TAXON_ID=385413 /ORGANISM="Thalassiosira miniscula, Strain CCMP1093" /LENGTH=105 /DNA_ID=CAMNT_0025967587 /DNA_START=1 /DNA_END=314 /DNA_ORIENTATION=+
MGDGWICPSVPCPGPAPTESNPIVIEIPISSPVQIMESTDCPNPCPWNYSGLQTKPGTNCKKFVNCVDGEVTDHFACYADNFFSDQSKGCLNIRDMGDGWICPSV